MEVEGNKDDYDKDENEGVEVEEDKDDNEEDNNEDNNYAYFMHFQHVINVY